MMRLLGAMSCACACMLYGCMRYRRHKGYADMMASFLQALQKLNISLQLSALPLPRQLMDCAPNEKHYLHRLGSLLEKSAAPPREIMGTIPYPPLLPAGMQAALLRMMESFQWPLPALRQKAMDHILLLWEQETNAALDRLHRLGKLTIQLSVLGGCALFILFC